MKSYREVLLRRVPEGQRSSARALIFLLEIDTGHGTMLSALIRRLEGGADGGPPPGGDGGTSTTPFLSASLDFTSTSVRTLRIGGSGFQPGETVQLTITTKVGDAAPDPVTTQTHPNGKPITAGSLGEFAYEQGVFCAADILTKFTAQAKGLSSNRVSLEAGQECFGTG